MQGWSTYTRYGDPEQAAGLQVDGPTFWAQSLQKILLKKSATAESFVFWSRTKEWHKNIMYGENEHAGVKTKARFN